MMDTHLSKLMRKHFNALKSKDLKAVLGFYHDDIDPHYPKVHIQGKDDVFKGLTWSFTTVKSFSFSMIKAPRCFKWVDQT